MISQSAIAREISGLEDRIKEVSLKDESTDSIVTEKDRVEKIVLKNEETGPHLTQVYSAWIKY
jgi:hypothetical protein